NAVRKILKAKIFDRPPVLIGGCGRSGTSILLSILSAHPNIYGIDVETDIFGYRRRFSSTFLNHVNNYRKLLPYLLESDKVLTATRWCEKTPRNVRFLPEIAEEFRGKFRFVHIIRDGRDVVCSRHPLSGAYHVSTERWVNDVKAGLKFLDHPNVFTLKYEDLVLNFKARVSDLLTFLDEEYCVEVEQFQEFANVKKHAAFEDGRLQGIKTGSIQKWKRDEHRERMDQFYKSDEAVDLLRQLGYEVSW
ncbi:MAG TPA: sulfotransferase, partial [Cyclobacteriaceae bacterium]|nr:sulfotransferase [Cyclobacteriaceae bacterium]